MSKNAQEVVYEGWLTKSPPTKRIWRARWRRRWFSLRHSGELPGQFLLTYYTDRNCRKLKGVIDLDHCEQVDLGLKLEERKLKFDHVFDIKTPTRTYYLAADTENEMKSWVNCICRVCGLKCTSGDDDAHILLNGASDVEIVEETESVSAITENETPPVSPVSPSPYIPISECFSGRSPLLESQDFQTLLDHNIRNSYHPNEFSQPHSNDTYELHQRTYLNCTDGEGGLQFYDCPRKLTPQTSAQSRSKDEDENGDKDEKYSPLQSPTDSESVFTDDDWTHNTCSDLNTPRTTRPSDSSADIDLSVTQKFTKMTLDNPQYVAEVPPVAPPRPPKPSHIAPGPNYFNLPNTNAASIKSNKENSEKCVAGENKLVTDDMYDFPRSHQMETESIRNTLTRRHNYNNAEPSNVEGQIFKYDISPKPGTSTTVFKYDTDEAFDEPASPLSQGSACATYLNPNSPFFDNSLLSDNQGILMPPPVVNRGLKPKRKLSDSVSVNSNTEPSSPRSGPSIDRKLKPSTPLQNSTVRKTFETDEENNRKPRAAPSPTTLGRSHECLLGSSEQEQIYQFLPASKKMQYLDLDLDIGSSPFSAADISTLPSKSSESNTVYKEVDFTKTRAFNLTKNNLERERMETGTTGSLTFSKK